MSGYFCGWYFRCQAEHHTLAIIASYHKAAGGNSCVIQLVTDEDAFCVSFPYSDFKKRRNFIKIANNRFSRNGIWLNIQSRELRAYGTIYFGPFRELPYDIMGPFRFLPLMQCRHSVYSMRHTVNGNITVNGKSYSFQNAVGYIEGDRGYSFPKNYVWTQCSFSQGSLMLSVADIPLGPLHFTGVIGIVHLQEKEYRLATYLGAKVIKITPDEIVIRQGNCTLSVKPMDVSGHPLQAPLCGIMARTIHEHPSCRVSYRLEQAGFSLLELDAPNAALEYEY